MATAVFLFFIALSLALALLSKRKNGSQSVHDFFVASRQFGTTLVFFLTAGEIYSIGTMVGFPGGIYAKGPTYGVWFLGYILLAYPIGYFLGPKIWQAGQRYNAITLADLFKGHYGSQALEKLVAASAILFLLPWGQLQFTGLVAAFNGLGWSFSPFALILIAAALAFSYILIAGVRASAYIAILKDVLMVVAIVVAGLAVGWEFGVERVFKAASLHVSNSMNGDQLTFAMSTMLFQSLGFYIMPFAVQNFFTAKSAGTIRRTQIAMPLYMLMYPFLVLASYYALSQDMKLASPNDAFFAAVVSLLPAPLVGLVAAGAALSGLLVLTGISLAIGPLVARNLLPGLSEKGQKTGAKLAIVVYLLVSIVMTLATPNLMLTLINTTYYGITQFLPGVLAILFGWRLRPVAIGTGIVVGQASAVALYLVPPAIHGFNVGLLCLAVNAIAVVVVDRVSPRLKVAHT